MNNPVKHVCSWPLSHRLAETLCRIGGLPGLAGAVRTSKLHLLSGLIILSLLAVSHSGAQYSATPRVAAPGDGLSELLSRAQPPDTNRAADKLQSTNSMKSLDNKYKLAIGDHISFRIEEDLEDPKALVVTDSGDLEVPYLGRFPAEGKTCRQLATQLKTALEKDYYYQATVIIAVDQMTKSRGKVYIVGPVRVPGPQDIPSDEVLTLSKAILRAGGFNDFADRHNVKLSRKSTSSPSGTQTFTVDVAQIFDKGKTGLDMAVEPGDLILVSERLVRF